MKLVTFLESSGEQKTGELSGEFIYPLAFDGAMLELVESGELSEHAGSKLFVSDVKILAPIIPRKIIAVGRNYAEHAQELNNAIPERPLLFAIYPSSIIGTDDVITWRESITQQVDWEGELAIVIGKTAKDVAEADANKYIFGYTIANDVSARDLQASDGQWIRAKSMDTFLPLGPGIVTNDELADPQNLQLQTFVNGEKMQDSNTSLMLFTISYLVAYCSRMFTLEAGDVILTGTPSGVGKGMKPPRYLTTGDRVAVTIDGIGTLSNTCQALP